MDATLPIKSSAREKSIRQASHPGDLIKISSLPQRKAGVDYAYNFRAIARVPGGNLPMKKLLLALAMLPLTQGVAFSQTAPTGDVAAGKALWDNDLRCKDCHGGVAEGAFGPDLAGRGLNFAQVKQAVCKAWGVMPRFLDEQVSEQEVANLAAS